jgi:signal peptidase II
VTKNTGSILLALLVIFLDRATKVVIDMTISHGTYIALFPYVGLTKVFNTGIAFGVGQTLAPVHLIVGIIIVGSLLYQFNTFPKSWHIPIALIIGAAIGNIIDRIIYPQGVLDFVSVSGFSVFNVADATITLAGIWLLILIIKKN